MLVIRQQQMSALLLDRLVRFEDRLLDRFAADYPGEYASAGAEGARSMVRRVLAFASARGIQEEAAIGQLFELWLEYGEELDRAPYRHWALRILGHARLPGILKVGIVRERLSSLTQGRAVVRCPVPSQS